LWIDSTARSVRVADYGGMSKKSGRSDIYLLRVCA
jgi:hypothetical protein